MDKLFKDYNIDLNDEQQRLLNDYLELLLSYNKKINLTAIIERDEIWKDHFLDSALLLPCLDSLDGGFLDSSSSISIDKSRGNKFHLLDVGTGAGFPGMVLAILKPEWEVVLLDSLNKRVDFLNLVTDELGLNNVTAIHGRAEDLAREVEYREGFDLVVSRAVAELRLLLELCVPFVKPDGRFFSYKGPKHEEELTESSNALSELNCKFVQKFHFDILGKERYLLEFSRGGELSERYPRRAGIPAKRPL